MTTDDFPAELAMNYAPDEQGREQMTEEQLEGIVEAEAADAVAFIDSDLGKARSQAIKYYRGDPLGNEEEGRSQVVSRDVADTIAAALPSLMRVFFGPEHVVEFVPECEEDEPLAEQQTDYINYIVTRDNPGFEIFYAVIKNALREKVGIVKYWWDDSVEVRTRAYTGLDMDSLVKLLEDVSGSLEAEISDQSEGPDGTLDVTLKLKKKRDRACIEALPPEEFLINRDAKSLDTARFVAHRRDMTVSDLVALGYDKEMVEANSGQEDSLINTDERLARNRWADSAMRNGNMGDKTTHLVRYVEAYVTVDYDGDGIAELMRVCTIGKKVVHKEAVDERPFADFHCDPEPHTFFGESLTDKVSDLQVLKTALLRSGLDSLASAIFPRPVVGPGANVDDVLNNEVGAVIRTTNMDAVRFEVTPDVSERALGWLQYSDEVRENRTGMSKVSMGLDAEALQNSTATASEAHFSRSQERLELIARIMASGFRRLFRGLSHLVAANQRQSRVVKLRNQWVEIDPRAWRVDMDVQPMVGLGGGSQQQKAQFLALVMSKQEGIFQQYGLQNPFVSVKQYLDTLGKFVELSGFKTPSSFFNDPTQGDAQAQQMMAEKAQQGPPPDPKMVEAQGRLQLANTQAEGAARLDQAKTNAQLQADREKTQAQLELERDKATAQAQLDREKLAAEMEIKREQMLGELRLREQQMQMEFALREQQIKLDAKLDAKDGDDSDDEDMGDPVEFGGQAG